MRDSLNFNPWEPDIEDFQRALWRGEQHKARQILRPLVKALRNASDQAVVHKQLVETIGRLAEIYCLERFYFDAESLYSTVLDVEVRLLGADHPQVVQTLKSIAHVKLMQKEYARDSLAGPLQIQGGIA